MKKPKISIKTKGLHILCANNKLNRDNAIDLQPENLKSKKIPKPLSIYFDSVVMMDTFKSELENCGAIFTGRATRKRSLWNSYYVPPRIRLEHVKVVDWTKKDVLEWLRHVKLLKWCEKAFRENDIDGMILEELSTCEYGEAFKTYENIGLNDEIIPKVIKGGSRIVKEGFSFARNFLLKKFSSLKEFGDDPDHVELKRLINILIEGVKVKHYFLNTADFLNERIQKMFVEICSGIKGKSFKEDDELYDRNSLMQFDERKIMMKTVLQPYTKQIELKKMISPLSFRNCIDEKAIKTEGLMLKTAIVVGPWFLEWTEIGIVIPRRIPIEYYNYLPVLNSEEIDFERVGREIVFALSRIISECNLIKSFSKTNNDTYYNRTINNQGFVDDVRNIMAASRDNELNRGSLEAFLKGMREKGVGFLVITPSKEFCECFNMKEKVKEFQSHKELDLFCCSLIKKCGDVEKRFRNEGTLLRAFDRVFWICHLSSIQNTLFHPIPQEGGTGCPFGNPQNIRK